MWAMMGGLLFWSIVSGLIPVVNAEVLVVIATVAVSTWGAPVVAAIVTLGQMIAKTGLFFAARWAPSRLPVRAQDALDKGSAAIEARPGAVHSIIGVSAVVGLPPFYAVSLAAGALNVPWASFFLIGLVGRAFRFGALAYAAARFGEVALDFIG